MALVARQEMFDRKALIRREDLRPHAGRITQRLSSFLKTSFVTAHTIASAEVTRAHRGYRARLELEEPLSDIKPSPLVYGIKPHPAHCNNSDCAGYNKEGHYFMELLVEPLHV